MRFEGAFICDTCHHRYTIEIGPVQLKEWRSPKRIGEMIGGLAKLFARSCQDCESGHAEETASESRKVHYGPPPGCTCTWDHVTVVDFNDENEMTRIRVDPNCPVKDHED
jgi:uncharacterized protein YlaI